MRAIYWSAGILLLAFAFRAAAESINPPTKPQIAPMTAQEKKNLDMVMNWWREVLYAGHFEVAPKYQAEDYIQHNPNANTGRAGFVEFFTKLGRKPINPIPKAMPADQMPVVSGAKGDFVWLIFEHEAKDPRNPRTRITTIRSMCCESKTEGCRNTGTAPEKWWGPAL